ncbi:DUF4232 domain-containing protein [Streptomyces sp. NPDC046215]|uniref:DUF4232 domain-containing protein n=1 Tax=Streptomyces stramineus TaxID=173861 RepID=A0ABP3K2U8_9ACTN
MRASTRRLRLLAAASVAFAALALTACDNGEGTRQEGAASEAEQPSEPMDEGKPAQPAPKPDRSTGATAPGEKGTSGKGAGRGSAPAADDDPNAPAKRVPCTAANSKITAAPVPRPLNHMLLTITNTGSKMCDLPGYPIVKFEGAQSVPPVMEQSKPQAVVSLAPGKKGYAGVILSAGDGSGGEGRTVRSLEIGFQGSDRMAPATLQAKDVYIDASLRVTYWLPTPADALT